MWKWQVRSFFGLFVAVGLIATSNGVHAINRCVLDIVPVSPTAVTRGKQNEMRDEISVIRSDNGSNQH